MEALLQHMLATGVLRTPHLIDAFRAVDRAHFVPEALQAHAYEDCPLPIGYEQTISQPSTVAFMLELLAPQKGHHILDIGSGSGWTTALLAHIVGKDGSVRGLERIEPLITESLMHLEKYHFDNAIIERASTELGDITHAPFDRILVSASATSFPQELMSQVREGGVLVIPVREAIWKITRIEHQPMFEKFDGYLFVPLIVE
jgi:protein-L-isoaspartate(D-aspartate) O-methyltransferase